MQTKLTLSINRKVIKKAKRFAKDSDRSLSNLVENYLMKISSTEEELQQGALQNLYGVIELPEEFDEQNTLSTIQENKMP